MESIGKLIRLRKFIHKKCNVILPIDHGVTYGPIDGLHPIQSISKHIVLPYINGIIAHRGVLKRLLSHVILPPSHGIIVQLNGMLSQSLMPNQKKMLTSVESAVKLGADAVSIQLNFDEVTASENVSLLASITEKADSFGLPVLVMLYDKISRNDEEYVGNIRHLIRLCIELSVDMIKISMPTDCQNVSRILNGFERDIYIYFAGGEVCEKTELIKQMQSCISLGATGFCMGRNIFQRSSEELLMHEFN